MTGPGMYLSPDATCAVCGKPPAVVAHQQAGVYDPQVDRHFCDYHRWPVEYGTTGVRIWTQGWEAGYRAGRANPVD